MQNGVKNGAKILVLNDTYNHTNETGNVIIQESKVDLDQKTDVKIPEREELIEVPEEFLKAFVINRRINSRPYFATRIRPLVLVAVLYQPHLKLIDLISTLPGIFIEAHLGY